VRCYQAPLVLGGYVVTRMRSPGGGVDQFREEGQERDEGDLAGTSTRRKGLPPSARTSVDRECWRAADHAMRLARSLRSRCLMSFFLGTSFAIPGMTLPFLSSRTQGWAVNRPGLTRTAKWMMERRRLSAKARLLDLLNLGDVLEAVWLSLSQREGRAGQRTGDRGGRKDELHDRLPCCRRREADAEPRIGRRARCWLSLPRLIGNAVEVALRSHHSQ
jgi:hypothetical protein